MMNGYNFTERVRKVLMLAREELDIARFAILESKAHAPLVVDCERMLTGAILLQRV
jgi:hypothetical protein